MTIIKIPINQSNKILALGAESAGNFSFCQKNQIQLSPDFGDLLAENNWQKYQRTLSSFLRQNKIKPTLIITDLHPLYKTTSFGQKIAKKYQAKLLQVQHHHAHLCSTLGEYLLEGHELPTKLVGIVCDGTGYGLDGNIWGGEVFKCQMTLPSLKLRQAGNDKCPRPASRDFIYATQVQYYSFGERGGQINSKFRMTNSKSQAPNTKQIQIPKFKTRTSPASFHAFALRAHARWERQRAGQANFDLRTSNYQIARIGSLEPQTLIGGDLAVREPARVLLAILHQAGLSKEKIWSYLKKYYSKNQFELLYNQLLQNFNCQSTTSTARIVDAASLLLGFCKNTRNYKHEPAILLEKNSSIHYDLRPTTYDLDNRYGITTTHLFKYLIKNLHKDKKRLAATVQLYLAQGLYDIASKCPISKVSSSPSSRSEGQCSINDQIPRLRPSDFSGQANSQQIQTTDYELRTTNYELFFSGGLAANKIMSEFLMARGAVTNKKLPCGDASLSFGQIVFVLLS